MRQPREEVRPGERAGIRVGQVDLDLRDHHEQRGCAQHPGRRVEHVAEAGEVHLGRLDSVLDRYLVLQREEREKRTAEHLHHARHDPARPRHQHRAPPAPAVGGGLLGQEAQVVDLLADLHDERERDRGRGAEHQRVEAAAVRGATDQRGEVGERARLFDQHGDIGQHEQADPDRLRPQLQARDQRDAVHHQRHHDERGDEITHCERPVEVHLQCKREDRRFEREEDEGEARVHQRGDGRAEVAEAGAARQQVHVDAVLGGVVADRQACEERDEANDQYRPECVGETVAQRDHAADRFEREKRGGAERGVGHAELAPLAEAARRVAQRVVLHRLVGHPGVVVAPDAKDFLGLRGHGHHAPEAGNG